MKKKGIISLICLLIILTLVVTFYKIRSNKKVSKSIRVAEVTHSAFYAPLYVAIENDYFLEEGLDIELTLTPGADKVSSAVLSNDVEIGFAGAESAIYVYNGGEKDYLKLFSGLTKRDGQFIISRTNEDFKLDHLKGKEILVGRKGGMPAINFLNALKNANIDPKEININYSVEFAALSGSFVGGVGDYVNLFEPTATALEKESLGYIVGNIGTYSGIVPYTAFYARKSYIDNNYKTIKKFNKALNKAISFVQDNEPEKIAEVILPQFSNLSKDDLTTIIKNYKEADSWFLNTTITEESYNNLKTMMKDNNLLKKDVPYKNIVIDLNNE